MYTMLKIYIPPIAKLNNSGYENSTQFLYITFDCYILATPILVSVSMTSSLSLIESYVLYSSAFFMNRCASRIFCVFLCCPLLSEIFVHIAICLGSLHFTLYAAMAQILLSLCLYVCCSFSVPRTHCIHRGIHSKILVFCAYVYAMYFG